MTHNLSAMSSAEGLLELYTCRSCQYTPEYGRQLGHIWDTPGEVDLYKNACIPII